MCPHLGPYVDVLTPRTSGCECIWGRVFTGVIRSDKVTGWALAPYDRRPCRKSRSGHRHSRRDGSATPREGLALPQRDHGPSLPGPREHLPVFGAPWHLLRRPQEVSPVAGGRPAPALPRECPGSAPPCDRAGCGAFREALSPALSREGRHLRIFFLQGCSSIKRSKLRSLPSLFHGNKR